MRRLPTLLAAAFVAAGCGGERESPVPIDAGTPPPPELVRPLGLAVVPERLREDEPHRRRFLEHATLVVPEQAMFWSIIQPERGDWRFAQADRLAELARARRIPMRGVLVWDQVVPDWITKRDWTRAALERVYVDHVRTIVRRYAGVVDSWIVVNEPLEDDGRLTESQWRQVLGTDYLALAFETARQEDPTAQLILNEIAAERGRKLDALVGLAQSLLAAGVPVDGIGLQDHTTTGDFPTVDELQTAMRRFAALGLDTHLTEVDVVVPPGGAGAALRRQADAYRAAAEACTGFDRCRDVTVWGVTDRWSWKGEAARALPWASDGTPKPAARALLEALRR